MAQRPVDPGQEAYRRFLMVFGLVGAVIATTVGGVLIMRGKLFYSFLALCVVAFIIVVVQGYRQDAGS